MNTYQMVRERVRLQNLQYWLTFAGASSILVLSLAIFQMGVVLPVLCLTAAGFSVYILRALIAAGKKGWVTAFGILVGGPFLLCLIPDESGIVVSALWFIPLVTFYFYCWLLRYCVTEWLSDLGDEKAFEHGEKNSKVFDGFADRFR